MKKILFSLLLLLTAATALWAQAPQRISYQSIIRDGSNVVVASTAVGIKISVVRGTASGTAVYVETHRKTTNANGLVSLEIGEGTALLGTFAGIDWSNGPYLIKTETDPAGGTNYSIPGIAALNSVPYALNANSAGKAITLATPRAINGVPFDGSADITVTASAATVTGTLAIANGGTGATTIASAKTALGLENVDNTSDANKPVSTATQTSLATKVDKVTGKELSTNDYTTAEKTKLAAITGTNTGDQDLSALATTAAVATKASTVELATGLALKANATDVTTSLATKVDKVTGKELSTNDYTTAEKTKLASITGTNTGDQTNITGNAATATKLLTSVTINGVAFDGSSNVSIPATGAVPYTGATQAVDLGAYDLKVNGLTIGRGAGNVDGNTANGSMSLYSNSSGNSNTAYGYASLYSNTTGSSNIANGNQSLYFNTTGSNNTAIGNASLNSNIEGVDNTANGFGALYRNTGGYNTASGSRSLYSNTTGGSNTALGYSAGTTNTTGTQNTLIGYSADVSSNNLSNATALGNQAIVTASNSIQLGNTSVTNVKTSGTLTAGAVTYPNTVGSNGQVLTTDGLGAASWASAPTYSVGLNPALGGYVFYVTPDGKHGLVAETIDQFGASDYPFESIYRASQGKAIDNISNPTKHSAEGANFMDWRLPSRYEVLLMYNTIGPGATGSNRNIGNFRSDGLYLSSTVRDEYSQIGINFSTGLSQTYYLFSSSPSAKESARAVRSF
jgi:hypothetical protein